MSRMCSIGFCSTSNSPTTIQGQGRAMTPTTPKKAKKAKISNESCGPMKGMQGSFLLTERKEDTTVSLVTMLPVEGLLLIFSFLELEEVRNLSLVCNEWNTFASDNVLWKTLCLRDWGISTLCTPTWKETYMFLDELFSEGVWEGMSKWTQPEGYDNEQKTTAKLHFKKYEALSKSLKIAGSGITINCNTPSPFKIEGDRINSDFQWSKKFEKHTSFYTGQIDLEKRSVSGNITYNDGHTQWKGIFIYTKPLKGQNAKTEVMA